MRFVVPISKGKNMNMQVVGRLVHTLPLGEVSKYTLTPNSTPFTIYTTINTNTKISIALHSSITLPPAILNLDFEALSHSQRHVSHASFCGYNANKHMLA